MKNIRLVPGFTLRREKLSINQIAKQIIDFYIRLSSFDTNHSQVNIVSEKKSLHQSIEVNTDNAEKRLAEEILHQNTEEIRKMDKVENPTLDFVMDKSIISIGLQTTIHGETLTTLNYSFLDSNNLKSGVGSIVINPICFDTFEKAKFFLDAAKASFSVDHSVIKIFDRDLNKVARGYKAPLGWITYFSNDYETPIPDDLEGIEYEYTDNGKYLILSREDITTDPEKYEAGKQKLLEVMEEIKRRVPEHGK